MTDADLKTLRAEYPEGIPQWMLAPSIRFAN
jgi:hypothetical protein